MILKDTMVLLDNNTKYAILDFIEYQSIKYALCVRVSEDEKSFDNNYDVFECGDSSSNAYLKIVEDENLYKLLCDMFDLKISRRDN